MVKLKNRLKNLTHKQIVITGVLLSIIGITLLSYNYINKKIELAYDKMNFVLLENEQPEFLEEETSENIESGSPNSSSNNTSNSNNNSNNNSNTGTTYQSLYVGTLEIPRISLKKGFTDIGSKANTVSKNITVIKGSNYPDKNNSNFILAAHSGNSSIAYFKELYKLETNDLAVINYNKVKYTYQIVNIYLQPKTGKVTVYRDTKKKTLTLITCTENDKNNQTVYIAELIKEENL